MATKKTSGTGTTRSRSKKAVVNPEVTEAASTNPSTSPIASSDGAAVAPAREKSTATTTSASTRTVSAPNFNHPAAAQERIRQRAYELFEQRGGQHGFDIEDWLRAEAEFKQR